MKKTINSEVAKSNVTTFAEVWKGHKELPRTELGAIILTDEKVCMLEPPHRYKYQNHELKVLSKRSGVEEAGGRTLYEIEIDGGLHKSVDITRIKQLIGCTYSRGKDGANGTAKTTAGQLHIWFSGRGAELNAKLKHPEFNAKFAELAKLAEDFVTAERKKREEDRAKADAESKKSKETDKTVEMLRKQGMSEEFIQMYLANRK